MAACRLGVLGAGRYPVRMGLTMSERKVVTKALATHYARADKAGKAVMLTELCAVTGWHRDHARRRTGLR